MPKAPPAHNVPLKKQLAQMSDGNNELRDIVSDLLMFMFKQDPNMMTGKSAIDLVARAHVAKAIHIRPKEDRPPEDVWVNLYRSTNWGGMHDTPEAAADALKKASYPMEGSTHHYTLVE